MEKYYNDIPIGMENAITKKELQIRWGMTERAVRAKIQLLRAADFGDDMVIISRSSGRGYYRTNNLEEIIAYKQEVINRGKHTFLPLRKVNRILNEENQLKFTI